MKMETKRKSYLVLAAALLLLVAGAAWAGISAGVLNNNDDDIDLTLSGNYKDGTASNPITFTGDSVNLTGSLTLGYSNAPTLVGFADNPNDIATDTAAGGAIYVGPNQTLNIRPGSSKSIYGISNSALRLYGTGVTNLYRGGTTNSYGHTFVQSGTLNLQHREALGGSVLILGGGATLGMTADTNTIDLTETTIRLRRYDGGNAVTSGLSDMVTFNTGELETNTMTLSALDESTGYFAHTPIKLVKDGLGKLVVKGVSKNTGGVVVEKGTLQLLASPHNSQTVEVKNGAVLELGVSQTFTVNMAPHPGSTIKLPSFSGTASTTAAGAGSAALTVSAFDKSALNNGQFKIYADLSGVTFPAESAENYYVKLVSCSSPHNLSASNISIDGISPATGNYSMKPYVDDNNIYAVLTWEAAITESISLTVARAADSATVTARLSDGADGKPITFALKNAQDETASQTVTSSNGSAQAQFSGLAYGTYTLSVSASGYNGASRTINIDGNSSTESSINVTVYDVYDETTGKKLLAVRLDNSPNAFPNNASFKYRFIEAGGTATGGEANPVNNNTTFTARNVTFSNNRTQARFDIDTSNLVADDGKTYTLAAGKTYQIWVEDANNADRSNGTSVILVDNNGQHVSSGSLMIATYAQAKSADWIAAWAIATKNGVAQPNVEITFTLLDIFGNAVNVDGVPNMPTQSTNANGRADVSFGPLPHDEYIIRTTVNNANITGYSRDVKLGSSSGGGGGCNAGFGLLALALAFAVAKRKKV